MDCPFCGKEMRAGWLYAKSYPFKRYPFWSPEQGKATRWMGKEDVPLMREAPEGFPPDFPAAHICKDCRRVVVEY